MRHDKTWHTRDSAYRKIQRAQTKCEPTDGRDSSTATSTTLATDSATRECDDTAYMRTADVRKDATTSAPHAAIPTNTPTNTLTLNPQILEKNECLKVEVHPTN